MTKNVILAWSFFGKYTSHKDDDAKNLDIRQGSAASKSSASCISKL
jgi:hypothetical protein